MKDCGIMRLKGNIYGFVLISSTIIFLEIAKK